MPQVKMREVETQKVGECAHCEQTVRVEKAPDDSGLEYRTRYHDWPPKCRAICRGRMMEPLNVREGEECESSTTQTT